MAETADTANGYQPKTETGKEKMNLINETEIFWRSTGCTISDGIRCMNDDLGTRYDLTRWGQWRRGERSMPEPVQHYCRMRVIGQVLEREAGIHSMSLSDETLDAIVLALEPGRAD